MHPGLWIKYLYVYIEVGSYTVHAAMSYDSWI